MTTTGLAVTTRGSRAYVLFEREGTTRAVVLDASGHVSALGRD